MSFFTRLFSRFRGGSVAPALPTITIGEGFWPQVEVVERDVKHISHRFHNFTEPFEESLHSVIIPSIAENFSAEGRPPWAQLNSSTVRKRGSAHPILVQSGELRRSATSADIWTIRPDEMYTHGPDVFYGFYHQGGTRKMPERPFMVLQESDGDKIQEVFGLWVDKVIREGGFR